MLIVCCLIGEDYKFTPKEMASGYLFTASMKAIYIKSGFDVIKDIASDVNITFDSDGIHMVAPDPDMVTILKFDVPTSLMTTHTFTADKPVAIGVNTTVFYKMIRSVSINDSISFEIHSEVPTVLKMILMGPHKTAITSLSSLPVPYVEMEFPSVDYHTVCEIPTTTLQRTLRDLSVLSKKVTLGTTGASNGTNTLVVATGGDSSTTSITIVPMENGLKWLVDTGALYHGRFFIKHIEQFLKPAFSKTVTLSMTETQPLMLKYTYGNNDSPSEEVNEITLTLLVAPMQAV